MVDASALVEEYLRALAERDVEGALDFYADHGAIVSYDGVAEGTDQIRPYLAGFLAAHAKYDLVSIDQL